MNANSKSLNMSVGNTNEYKHSPWGKSAEGNARTGLTTKGPRL